MKRINLGPRLRITLALRSAWFRSLDYVFSPFISRLTDDEYFSCRTHLDCARAYLRRRIAAA